MKNVNKTFQSQRKHFGYLRMIHEVKITLAPKVWFIKQAIIWGAMYFHIKEVKAKATNFLAG